MNSRQDPCLLVVFPLYSYWQLFERNTWSLNKCHGYKKTIFTNVKFSDTFKDILDTLQTFKVLDLRVDMIWIPLSWYKVWVQEESQTVFFSQIKTTYLS